mmetsp:Transcript_22958/g.54450  ORF Transcript_22958/g.54450 Transcript_22958/m.54450 type:complete len:232 (+) Transcript_22958:453-1148(+)
MTIKHVALNLKHRQNGVETIDAQEKDSDVNRGDTRVHFRLVLRGPVARINRAEEKSNNGGNDRSNSIVAGRTPINLPHSLEHRFGLRFGRCGIGCGKSDEICVRRLAIVTFDLVQGILLKLRGRKRRGIVKGFITTGAASGARHGQHPSCWIFAGLDLVGGRKTLEIFDELAALLTQVAEECGMTALLEQEKGVKVVEDCHGRLMNSCNDSAATIGNASHAFHDNACSASI